MDAFGSFFIRIRMGFGKVGGGAHTFDRTQLIYHADGSVSRIFNRVGIDGFLGKQVDFDNARPATGGSITAFSTVRPTDPVELPFAGSRRYLVVDAGKGRRGRLFPPSCARLRTP